MGAVEERLRVLRVRYVGGWIVRQVSILHAHSTTPASHPSIGGERDNEELDGGSRRSREGGCSR